MAIFVKVSKIINFQVISFLGNFYTYLAIFSGHTVHLPTIMVFVGSDCKGGKGNLQLQHLFGFSVIRLRIFKSSWVTNLLTKVAQIFNDL